MRTFTSDEDVWNVIDLLIEETEEANREGKNFNIAESVMAQLPFFSCNNLILDRDAQKDISRYIYSKDFGISPYKGSYGEQPKLWIEKTFILKNLMQRQENKAKQNG